MVCGHLRLWSREPSLSYPAVCGAGAVWRGEERSQQLVMGEAYVGHVVRESQQRTRRRQTLS